jgi:high-affinity iron transporter
MLAACSTWLVSWACRRSVDGDLPSAYRTVAIPADLTSAATIGRAVPLYRKDCALCHGLSGQGDGLQARFLDPKPRDLVDPTWRASTSPRHVYFAIREGVHTTAMPAWKGTLTERQSWDLAGYVLSLSGK